MLYITNLEFCELVSKLSCVLCTSYVCLGAGVQDQEILQHDILLNGSEMLLIMETSILFLFTNILSLLDCRLHKLVVPTILETR
jgi:hypothetical protein